MTDELVSELERIENELTDLKESVEPEISPVLRTLLAGQVENVREIKRRVELPDKPSTCEGFYPTGCNRRPNDYSETLDKWLCISCLNEAHRHYAS